jgi:hypothetical protein
MSSCIPLLIPLLSYSLASKYSPLGLDTTIRIVTVGLVFISTYIVAKIQCWNSDKSIILRSLAPTTIFILWWGLHYFPMTAPLMNLFGTNIFFIIALSFLFKMVYDYVMVC